jgi:hypothetical protein
MVKFLLHGPKTRFDISQALAISYLGKNHAEVLVETGERFYPIVAAVSPNAFVELFLGKEIDQL